MASRTHIVGAGLAGLAAAVKLASAGRPVSVYESAGHGGGRCRSFNDAILDRQIDNGNHLVLSGNRNVFAYLDDISSADTLEATRPAAFPFLDLKTGDRWTVKPGAGPLPWWVLFPGRRVPGTRAREYLEAFRLARAGEEATVDECLDTGGVLYHRFWESLAVSVLNTAPEEGAARLLWPVIRETFGRGEAACRPCIARQGLSQTFVEPALDFLRRRGSLVGFNRRLRALQFDNERVSVMEFGDDQVQVQPEESVILAVPPTVAGDLLSGLTTPVASRAIVNGHFLLEKKSNSLAFMGLVGGTGHWLFLRGDVVSVTVSAADDLAELPSRSIAETLWSEIAFALGLGAEKGGHVPVHRIVKEKRATFAQTPANMKRRPGTRTQWKNLYMAGDWTDTGLPATLEGAVKSGRRASDYVLSNSLNT